MKLSYCLVHPEESPACTEHEDPVEELRLHFPRTAHLPSCFHVSTWRRHSSQINIPYTSGEIDLLEQSHL